MPPLVSVTVSVITPVPNWLGKGAIVAVRLAVLPVTMTLLLEISPGLEEAAVTTKLDAAVPALLTVKASGPTKLSSFIDWSAMLEMPGRLLAAVTVNTKLVFALAVPSLTLKVIVAVPD